MPTNKNIEGQILSVDDPVSVGDSVSIGHLLVVIVGYTVYDLPFIINPFRNF